MIKQVINKMKERKTYVVEKSCVICGKKFNVRIRKADNKIISKCYHSLLPKHIFLGWTYTIDIDDPDFKITGINFKNKFWNIIGYTKIQREIVYFVWKLLFRRKSQRIEYWECSECS